MDLCLIHADDRLDELAQISDFDSFSAIITTEPDEDCDWELTMPEGAWSRCPVQPGHYVYIDGTEWGGPVEQLRHVSSDGQIRLRGTCWRGLLHRRIIVPDAGETHRILPPAEGNAAISQLLGTWRNDLFTVSEEDSGMLCPEASLRYTPLLEALDDLLGSAGARLSAIFDGGHVVLSALPSRDMSDMVELSQEYDARLRTDSSTPIYNHIIALGRGEMLERQVTELWLLDDGTLTDDPAAAPAGTSTLLYDYPAVESPEDLAKAARRKLLSFAAAGSMEIEMTDNIGLELTDTASVRDTLTGMTAVLKVTARELTVNSSGIILAHHLG